MVLGTLAGVSGFPHLACVRFDPQANELVFLAGVSPGPFPKRQPVDVAPWRAAVEDRRTLVLEAPLVIPPLELVVVLPLTVRDAVWGLILLGSESAGLLDETTLCWLENVSITVGNLIERREMVEALQRSESLLREAQAIARIGHYVFDIPADHWTSSPVLDDIFGISPDTPRDFALWKSLLHPEDRLPMERYFLQDVVAGHHPFDRRYRILRRNDGAVRWVHGLGRLAYDENGRALSMVGTIQDITEQHLTELAVQESERKYRSLFEHAGEGILVADFETRRFTFANPAICRLLGYSIEELMKLGVNDIHPPDALPQVLAEFEAQGRGEKTLAPALPVKRKDGSVFLADISTTSVILEGRHCNVGFFTDVTEREAIASQRRQMERRLLHSQKLESLGLLAGGIAHDFNNILMAVIGHANLARLRLPPEARVLEHITQIERAAARASDLARQLLAYSGKGKFVLEPVDLSRVVEEMTPLLAVSVAKTVTLQRYLVAPLPAVEADPTQMRQVVMNLVINASEAIGERNGHIILATGVRDCDEAYLRDAWAGDPLPAGPYVFLEVADSGCGMDRDTLARIFDPFFSTKFTGRGLGLAAVLGIVRGHKGGIKVYSEVGQGTTFKVFFPATHREAAPARSGEPSPGWRGEGRVLLVDDGDEIRSVARAMLEELGFSVLTAVDGKAAVACFREADPRPVLVLLDLTMPVLGGEETFRLLRQIDPQVPIVLMSGFNEQEVSQKFIGRGLAGFVQKPFDLAMLRHAIRQALEMPLRPSREKGPSPRG